jgi:hypothetical protein
VARQPRKLLPDGQHFCRNSDIQRGLAAVRKPTPASLFADLLLQKLEIKRGQFGLGAFAVDRIREDQFIGGTLISFTAI